MRYLDYEIDISNTNYFDNVAIINLPNGEIVCIPKENANEAELQIISEIKADVEARVVEVDIEALKTAKKDELWKACNESILSGFYFDFNGKRYLIGLDEQDQSNLLGKLALLDSIEGNIVWKVKGELIFLSLTKEEFIQMALTASSYKEGLMQTYFYMCSLVESASDIEMLNSIVW